MAGGGTLHRSYIHRLKDNRLSGGTVIKGEVKSWFCPNHPDLFLVKLHDRNGSWEGLGFCERCYGLQVVKSRRKYPQMRF